MTPRCGQREAKWYGDEVCRDAGFVDKSSMHTMSSQTWVAILDPLVVVDDPVRSLHARLEEILFSTIPRRARVSEGWPLPLVAGRGMKKEVYFLSESRVFEIPRGA